MQVSAIQTKNVFSSGETGKQHVLDVPPSLTPKTNIYALELGTSANLTIKKMKKNQKNIQLGMAGHPPEMTNKNMS